jgi:hypothetical protein
MKLPLSGLPRGGAPAPPATSPRLASGSPRLAHSGARPACGGPRPACARRRRIVSVRAADVTTVTESVGMFMKPEIAAVFSTAIAAMRCGPGKPPAPRSRRGGNGARGL